MKIIDCTSDAEFQCLLSDAELLFNLLEQKTRPIKKTDFIRPGLLSGQSLIDVLRETVKSINNHLDNFDKNEIML